MFNRTALTTQSPVSLDDAKLHAGIEIDDDDDLITAFLISATQALEEKLEKPILEATYVNKMSCFPSCIEIPFNDFTVESIQYLDEEGELQTLDPEEYYLDCHSDPLPFITPKYEWPDIYDNSEDLNPNKVIITIKTGFIPGAGTAENPIGENVPEVLKTAIKMLFHHLYENREAEGMEVLHENRALRLIVEAFKRSTYG